MSAIPSAAGVLLLATLAACSNPPELGSMGDFLTATVSNGATFNPANPTARVVGPVELVISGTDTVSAVSRQGIIDWYGTVSVGTFQLAAQALSYASYFETHGDSTYEWTSALNGATGTLTFTAVSSTRVAGKFTFTGVPVPQTGSTGSRAVSRRAKGRILDRKFNWRRGSVAVTRWPRTVAKVLHCEAARSTPVRRHPQ
jgi:hypothetical protein